MAIRHLAMHVEIGSPVALTVFLGTGDGVPSDSERNGARLNSSGCPVPKEKCRLSRLVRGGAVWQLVGLITRRSEVQILPPLPIEPLRFKDLGVFPPVPTDSETVKVVINLTRGR